MTYENENAGIVSVVKGKSDRNLYLHQEDAMKEMNKINYKDFNALVVLPTGGGKTLTSVWWLLKNAISNHDKVLWIAHRHLLLEQAAEAFAVNAYSNVVPNRMEYSYRIISGAHDKPVHITGEEDILICGKDSIVRNLSALDKWMAGSDIYLVVDEAHHAVARTYKKIIEYVKNYANEHDSSVKMLGLTATPYRTNVKEKAALGKIFTDDIIYSIDLDTLIKRGILSTPIFKTYETNTIIGESIDEFQARKISFSDNLPEDIANSIAKNKERNRLIVSKYIENKDVYKQTIVFALNVQHAIELKAVFEKYGVKADYIVSGIKDLITFVSRSKEDNARIIEEYRNKELEVLINVNILTEGTDLPQTQTVFLARPTVSKVLMTQMVGRALRGEKAGGTKEAYIVSFIDDWEDKIAFENPESILVEGGDTDTRTSEYTRRNLRYIAVSMVEEFARIVDETVDTSDIEGLPFSERIPLGMYLLSYLEEDESSETSIERNHTVLVYNCSRESYEEFLKNIDIVLKRFGIEGDRIEDDKIGKIVESCRETYFNGKYIPPVKNLDIESLLKFYAYHGYLPEFTEIDKTTEGNINLSYLAQGVLELHLDPFEEKDYLEERWNDDSTFLKTFYIDYEYFIRQYDKEKYKLVYGITSVPAPTVKHPDRPLEEFTLQEIKSRNPKVGFQIDKEVHEAAKQSNGMYKCVYCGMTSPKEEDFQIDHIKPMSKGGLTVRENLQLLCRHCNLTKSDHEDDLPLQSKKLSDAVMPNVVKKGDTIIVSLGDYRKQYNITDSRKKKTFFTFTINDVTYRFYPSTNKIERPAKAKKQVVHAEVN